VACYGFWREEVIVVFRIRKSAGAPTLAAIELIVAREVAKGMNALKESLNGEKNALEDEIRHVVGISDHLERMISIGRAYTGISKRQKKRVAHENRELAILVRKNLARLAVLGLKPIACGDRIDYARHEPLDWVPTRNPDDDGKIVEVVRTGYMADSRVWRPALVVILKYVSQTKTDQT